MRQRHHHRQFVLLGFALALALVFAMPTWIAAATTPTSVAVGASVTFTASGFAPNEALSVWETGPDGTPIPLAGAQSDGTGGYTTSVSFPTAGAWTVTAHGINSNKDFIGNFAVGTTSSTTTSPTATTPVLGAPAASSSGATAQGTSVGIGAFTTFSGAGFNPNEAISIWETPPVGSATTAPTALPGLQADSNGAFTDSISFPSAGQWQVTAQGVTSGHQVITPFAVGVPGSTPASVATGSGVVGGTGFNGTPASIGAVTTFSGSGFNANEKISLWTTAPAPDSTTAALTGINADGTGAFTTSVIFPTAGNWQVTAQGHDSAHQVIGRYAVSDSSSGSTTAAPATNSIFTSPFADVPVKATVGTITTYTATGFNAGETVFAWATPPDGSAVTALDQVQASSTGRATVSTFFGSVGLWQVTLHGRDSLHETVGKFQVTTA